MLGRGLLELAGEENLEQRGPQAPTVTLGRSADSLSFYFHGLYLNSAIGQQHPFYHEFDRLIIYFSNTHAAKCGKYCQHFPRGRDPGPGLQGDLPEGT